MGGLIFLVAAPAILGLVVPSVGRPAQLRGGFSSSLWPGLQAPEKQFCSEGPSSDHFPPPLLRGPKDREPRPGSAARTTPRRKKGYCECCQEAFEELHGVSPFPPSSCFPDCSESHSCPVSLVWLEVCWHPTPV